MSTKHFHFGRTNHLTAIYGGFSNRSTTDQTARRVLEVGTGSGYQAAVLCEMGVSLFTIERQRVLFDFSRMLLPKLGYHPQFFFGDGYLGLPTYGPFDKIIVTAGADFCSPKLLEQLAIGGRMVVRLR